jgi:hypothetical protein
MESIEQQHSSMSHSGTTTSSSSSTWFVPVLCEGLYLFVVSDCIIPMRMCAVCQPLLRSCLALELQNDHMVLIIGPMVW